MSIPVLNQVYDEMRRLAIAGSNLASDDFRLKKLIPPLQASAAKAPVFGKVAEAVQKLVEAPSQDSAASLLELGSLVSAILYTQGETGAAGELKPIETTELTLSSTNTSVRLLKPLIEALTTTGSGREEIIKDAQERGAFNDLRLVGVAVAAIDDPYGPIAEFVCDHVLPDYGMAIYDDLRRDFSPKAKGGQVRRLRLMHRLDADKTRDLVEQSLDSGSADMKVAAIACLSGDKETLSFLLEQTKAKSADVRRAAYEALSKSDDEIAVEALTKAIRGADLELAYRSAGKSKSSKLLKFLLAETEQQLEELSAKTSAEEAKAALKRFYLLLHCFDGRTDKASLALLTKCFQQRDSLAKLTGEVDGQQVNRYVAMRLVQSDDAASQKLVADAHETLGPESLDCAFLAAIRTLKPKKVFDLFSPYYLAVSSSAKTKKNDVATQKRDAVRGVISVWSRDRRGAYTYYHAAYFHSIRQLESLDLTGLGEKVDLDPRWLDAAIASGDLELIQALGTPKHKATNEFLTKSFAEIVEKKGASADGIWPLINAMVKVEHPNLVENFLVALNATKENKGYYSAYGLARLIPQLPKSAVAGIEALLPTLNERIVDQIVPYLAELQAKP